MALYALENIDDALAATRSFLWPIDRSRWAKLALLMVFIGGPATNTNFLEFNVPFEGAPDPTTIPTTVPTPSPRFWILFATVIAIAVLIGVVFLVIQAIMDFVLLEALRTETVRVREYWRSRWRQGVQLFVFRVALGLLLFGSIALFAAAFVLPTAGLSLIGPAASLPLAALIVVIPFLVVIAGIVGLVDGFTTVFVVPIMIHEECSIIAGWRRLLRSITGQPWQYLAYALLGFLLSIAGGILIGIAVALAVLVLMIPFGLLGLLGYVLFTAVPPIGIGVLVLVGIAFALTMLVAVAVARVPVVTYLRYYALFVLGDIEPDLDVIPDQRQAIRSSTS